MTNSAKAQKIAPARLRHITDRAHALWPRIPHDERTAIGGSQPNPAPERWIKERIVAARIDVHAIALAIELPALALHAA
ncbi:MAG: hypothetical protein E8D45_00425 [Nitrospira sp.]|nr:MAG: hypothetical protein E8D45_00425 [Nitrospira sp.]